MRMEKLFTYGTLQDPDTQKQVLGRTLGWRRTRYLAWLSPGSAKRHPFCL